MTYTVSSGTLNSTIPYQFVKGAPPQAPRRAARGAGMNMHVGMFVCSADG